MTTDQALWALLAWGLFPLWLASGIADYLCHARTDIAHTSGPRESRMHLMQTAEIGVPMLAFLFLRTNALVVLLMAAGVAAHTWTTWRDVRYAMTLRRIPVFEQLVHGFLLVLPIAALALVVVLHRAQLGGADAWTLALRRPALPLATLAAVLGAAFAFGVVPGVLEYLGTLRASGARRRGG